MMRCDVCQFLPEALTQWTLAASAVACWERGPGYQSTLPEQTSTAKTPKKMPKKVQSSNPSTTAFKPIRSTESLLYAPICPYTQSYWHLEGCKPFRVFPLAAAFSANILALQAGSQRNRCCSQTWLRRASGWRRWWLWFWSQATAFSSSVIARRHSSSFHGRVTSCTATGRPKESSTALIAIRVTSGFVVPGSYPWDKSLWFTEVTVTTPAGMSSKLYTRVVITLLAEYGTSSTCRAGVAKAGQSKTSNSEACQACKPLSHFVTAGINLFMANAATTQWPSMLHIPGCIWLMRAEHSNQIRMRFFGIYTDHMGFWFLLLSEHSSPTSIPWLPPCKVWMKRKRKHQHPRPSLWEAPHQCVVWTLPAHAPALSVLSKPLPWPDTLLHKAWGRCTLPRSSQFAAAALEENSGWLKGIGGSLGSPSLRPLANRCEYTRDKSAAVLAMTPAVAGTKYSPGRDSIMEIRPQVGFNEEMPQNAAGTRTEPPTSLPMPKGAAPPPIRAPSPALLPPELRRVSQGLRVSPWAGLPPPMVIPNLGFATQITKE